VDRLRRQVSVQLGGFLLGLETLVRFVFSTTPD
jgi:hypothetical protein